MAELFKFRCYQCQKLIGAPPSRFGSVVKCPKCAVELIVPSPDAIASADPESEIDPDLFRPEDLGLNLEPEPLRRPAAFASSQPTPVGPDPIAFLSRLDQDADSTDAEPSADDPPPEDGPDLIEPAVEPLVPQKRGRTATGGGGTSGRARDVILPRTAAVAWALFALFALALAFLAGLLLGQRLGK